MRSEWTRVSKNHPCPICGKPDWCGTDPAGAVCCMRVHSEHQLANGGWLHNSTQPRPPCPPCRDREPTPISTTPDFNAALWWQTARHVIRWEPMEEWSNKLGLQVGDLDVMGGCHIAGMLCFPMHDGSGIVCGIRTRYPDGSKKAITGSRAGVFLPTLDYQGEEVVICEGPTDAAAALALGFWPIGRPSCIGSEAHVVATCKRIRCDRVTLCMDSDGPGISGGRKMADALMASRISVRTVTPAGHKDLRDWYKAGATRSIVDAAWSAAEWRY